MFSSTYPDIKTEELREEYDYIIVGGGTAGCVLANRLSADKKTTVLVVEVGSSENGWFARNPYFSFHLADGSRSLATPSAPQSHVGNRVFDVVRGRTLGGTSKINGMLYSRGFPAEYNEWSQNGRKGWSYDEIQKYFIRAENALDYDPGDAPKYHGSKGEWQNKSSASPVWMHTPHIIRAAGAMGIPYSPDLNSPMQPASSCARIHHNVDRAGERSSTQSAFLPAALVKERKSNLHVCTNTLATKLKVVQDQRGQLIVEGVHVQSTLRPLSRFVRARKEVLLSAGALSSPKLLLLSGIGPAAHLKESGITVVRDLSGVGSHLQDHLTVSVGCFVPYHDSMIKIALSIWHYLACVLWYLLFGVGPFFSPYVAIFVQSRLFDRKFSFMTTTPQDENVDSPANLPDIELIPLAWGDPGACKARGMGGFMYMASVLHPTSQGTLRLASADPQDHPIIDLNCLATEHDRITARNCVKLTKHLIDRVMADGYPLVLGAPLPDLEDDAALDAFINKNSFTTFHYSATCMMAPEDEDGVVDDRLRVHGVAKLRVADTSICPRVPAAHTAAVAVMIAEKCSDMVLEDNGVAV